MLDCREVPQEVCTALFSSDFVLRGFEEADNGPVCQRHKEHR
jgi:hypothetical protein